MFNTNSWQRSSLQGKLLIQTEFSRNITAANRVLKKGSWHRLCFTKYYWFRLEVQLSLNRVKQWAYSLRRNNMCTISPFGDLFLDCCYIFFFSMLIDIRSQIIRFINNVDNINSLLRDKLDKKKAILVNAVTFGLVFTYLFYTDC